METQLEQLEPAGDRRLRLSEVRADRDLTRAQCASDQAPIRLGSITDRKIELLQIISRHSEAIPWLCVAPIRRDQRDHGVLVATDLQRQAAGLAQQVLPVADPQHGSVYTALHM